MRCTNDDAPSPCLAPPLKAHIRPTPTPTRRVIIYSKYQLQFVWSWQSMCALFNSHPLLRRDEQTITTKTENTCHKLDGTCPPYTDGCAHAHRLLKVQSQHNKFQQNQSNGFWDKAFFHFWPTVLSVTPLVHRVVCLSSVTFCIVAKRYILAKNCLKEWIGKQGQKVDFGVATIFLLQVSPLRPTRRPFLPYFCQYSPAFGTRWYKWTF